MTEENKTPNSQVKASRAWEERNKEKHRFDTARRQARRYIRDFAMEEDLLEVEQFIADRRKALQDQE